MKCDIINKTAESIINNVGKVIFGKEREIRFAVTAMLCRGHVLLDDIPGTGTERSGVTSGYHHQIETIRIRALNGTASIRQAAGFLSQKNDSGPKRPDRMRNVTFSTDT